MRTRSRRIKSAKFLEKPNTYDIILGFLLEADQIQLYHWAYSVNFDDHKLSEQAYKCLRKNADLLMEEILGSLPKRPFPEQEFSLVGMEIPTFKVIRDVPSILNRSLSLISNLREQYKRLSSFNSLLDNFEAEINKILYQYKIVCGDFNQGNPYSNANAIYEMAKRNFE